MSTRTERKQTDREINDMKINTGNAEKLNAAIDVAQKGCRARIIDADDIQSEVRRIERELCDLMPKSHWQGVKFVIDINAQSFPASYNGIPESTYFELERGSSAWFVTAIYRSRTKTSRNNEIQLNDEHRTAMLAHIERNF